MTEKAKPLEIDIRDIALVGPLDIDEAIRRASIAIHNDLSDLFANNILLLEQRVNYHEETRQVTGMMALLTEILGNDLVENVLHNEFRSRVLADDFADYVNSDTDG